MRNENNFDLSKRFLSPTEVSRIATNLDMIEFERKATANEPLTSKLVGLAALIIAPIIFILVGFLAG